MKITVINASQAKGCTLHMQESFLKSLREGNEITELYLPKDFPCFCTGCKSCFVQGEDKCPHAAHTMTIWSAILKSDLLVIAFPVYVSGIPGQLKALLDCLACHHIAHRPDKAMLQKRAVILSQSLRSSNRAAQAEVKKSLSWLGVSDIKSVGFKLKESYIWDELDMKRRKAIDEDLQKLAERYIFQRAAKKGLKVMLLFAVSRMLIKRSLKCRDLPSADAEYWQSQGWLS